MSWSYEILNNGQEMNVYDHNDNLITTLKNNGGGFVLPNDIFEVMIEEVVSRGLSDTSEWQTQTIVSIAADDVSQR